MRHLKFIATLAAVLFASAPDAATLGLSTSAPTIAASTAQVDYLEFSPDGDLSAAGMIVDGSSLITLAGVAEISFGIGFDLANPDVAPSGGFDIYDDNGLYLAGDLIALGFRAFGGNGSLIELHFGQLSGNGEGEWTDTLLMNVIFPSGGGNPFDMFVDGENHPASIGIFAVTSVPTPIPLPGGLPLLLGGLLCLRWRGFAKRAAQ